MREIDRRRAEWVAARAVRPTPEVLALIVDVLEAGPLVAIFRFSGGEHGPTLLVFRSVAAFSAHRRQARVGETYELWSLPALVARQSALLHVVCDAHAPDELATLIARGMAALTSYLSDPDHAYIALVLRADDGVRTDLGDDDNLPFVKVMMHRAAGPGATLALFPFTDDALGEPFTLWAIGPPGEGETGSDGIP